MLPLWRDIYLAVGYVDAGYTTAIRALNNGYSVVVLPGGEQEMILSTPGENRIVLEGRKGFIRLALENGAWLVPVYSFGAVDTYAQANFAKGLNRWLSKTFRIVLPILVGRWNTTYPFRKPVNVVVGQPIPVEKIPDFTEKDVDHLHALYVARLKELFERNKALYGCADQELIIEAVHLDASHHKQAKKAQ